MVSTPVIKHCLVHSPEHCLLHFSAEDRTFLDAEANHPQTSNLVAEANHPQTHEDMSSEERAEIQQSATNSKTSDQKNRDYQTQTCDMMMAEMKGGFKWD